MLYILLCNKLPPIWQLKTTNIYYLRFYVASISRSDLAGRHWLRVSQEVTVKLLVTEVVSSGGSPRGRINWQARLYGCWQGSVHCRLLANVLPQFLVTCSLHVATSLPQSKQLVRELEPKRNLGRVFL